MPEKKSAHYQRLYRQRMRDMGLVKKEVWILPERAAELHYLERELRRSGGRADAPIMEQETEFMKNNRLWTTQDLFEALSSSDLFTDGRAEIEVVNSTEPCLHIVMHDYGDLPIFMTVSRQHILVEAALWPVTAVKDQAAFNHEVLRTHKFFSLSTVAVERMAGGEEFYTMFGSLSAASILPNVLFEIETLADNVIRATEAYEDFLVPIKEAS